MAAPPRYRIHPAIGIARVGNAAADQFFLGPEQPNQPPGGVSGVGQTVPPFKTGGLIRRQAARFRVFEYTESKGVYTVSREITLDQSDVVELTWSAHLVNSKAAFFTFRGLVGSPLVSKTPKRRNAKVNDRRSLIIDPLPRSIAGKSAKPVLFKKGTSASPDKELWPTPAPTPTLEYLGELRTDASGRLIVIGGAGVVARQSGAADIKEYANNDGWFDDVSDGPVTVKLRLKVDGKPQEVTVAPAWVLVGPPDFAPALRQTVSLWDVLFDLAAREIPLPKDEAVYTTGALSRMPAIAKDLSKGASFSSYKPTFDDDIAPVLRQAIASRWVFDAAQNVHTTFGADGPTAALWKKLSDPSESNTLRQDVLSYVRKPGTPGVGRGVKADMPRLLGDDPYNKFKTGRWGVSVTVTQYAALEQWARGNFVRSALTPASLLVPPMGSLTPDGLDRAALENASGGAFYPGIEVGWQIREPALFDEPFRIKHGAPSKYVGDGATVVAAGHFSRQMALPWVADFLQCKVEEQKINKDDWGWWPSQRPDAVYDTEKNAAAKASMLPWHRAAVGTSSDWAADTGEPKPRDSSMPSYMQMLANWWKFGFVVDRAGGVFVESERPSAVP
jgi:L-lysine epsilon oxidase-like protein